MTYQETVRVLVQTQELCETITEGMRYYAAHLENAQLLDDIQNGLSVIETTLQEHEILSSSIKARLKKSRTFLSHAATAKTIPAQELMETVTAAVVDAIAKAIAPETYLDRDTAEKLFALFQKIPHNTVTVLQLIFDASLKSGISAPAEAFEQFMTLAEEQPGMLSGKNSVHPEYVYHPSTQRTFTKCPICDGEGNPFHFSFSYRMNTFTFPHLPAKLWMKCKQCGNLYTWKYPEELLTQADNPIICQPRPERFLTSTKIPNAHNLSIWCAILDTLQRYTSGKTLLEVGVGNGELLAVALELGYKADAVEIVREEAQFIADMLNIPVWNGDFLAYNTDKRYDIISMGDVIEHVTNPEQALRNAYRLLADDGVLWLSTPNFESSFSKILKFQDPMWLEPYHITYFSYRGLKPLIEKCGFCVREYKVSNRYNGSMELILTKQKI